MSLVNVGKRSVLRMVPPGCVISFSGSSEPDGWLKCDGRSVSQSTYADLYAVIGSTYGSDSTTFNLPDMSDYFVRGTSANRNVGSKESDDVGFHSHNANTGDAGSHSHSGNTDNAGSHVHPLNFTGHNVGSGNANNEVGFEVNDKTNDFFTITTGPDMDSAGSHSHNLNIDSAGSHSHAITVSSAGSGQTRPKNIALIFIIKY